MVNVSHKMVHTPNRTHVTAACVHEHATGTTSPPCYFALFAPSLALTGGINTSVNITRQTQENKAEWRICFILSSYITFEMEVPWYGKNTGAE